MSTARGYYSSFDPSMPWGHAYRHLLQDQAFWQQHVSDPCSKLLREKKVAKVPASTVDPAITKQLKQVVSDMNVLKRSSTTAGLDASTSAASSGSGTLKTHSADGVELCRKFYMSGCVGLGACPLNAARVHLCPLCLTPHYPNTCPNKQQLLKLVGNTKPQPKKKGKKTTQ